MRATSFTRLVGCELPVQQAPMGGVGTGPDLGAAVAAAGGHGMVAATVLPAPALEAILAEVARRTDRPVGVNLLIPFLDRACLEVAAAGAGYVDFFYGDPDAELVEAVHAGGAVAGWQVGSAEEARAAADAGCDVIVAQGIEAGGRIRGRLALLPLLEAVLEAVEVPVLGAGGIATPRGVAAVLAAGAAGARVGTRFIPCPESDTHPVYAERVLGASGQDTEISETFAVMWPDAPHRALRSSIEAALALTAEVAGETVVGGRPMPIPARSVPTPTRRTTGDVEAMAMYAGQSVGLTRDARPAGEIVAELAAGAEELLRAAGG